MVNQTVMGGPMGNKNINLQAAPNATVNMANNSMASMPNAMSMAPNNGTQQLNPMQQGEFQEIG